MPSRNPSNPFIRYWHAERFLILLISLLLLLVLSPFLNDLRWFGIIRGMFTSWIFLEIFHTTTWGKKWLTPGAFLVVFAIIAVWVDIIMGTGAEALLPARTIIVIFLFFSIVVLSKFISGAERVDRQVIYVAVIIYLLISMVWGYFYMTLEFFVPGSFDLHSNLNQSDKFIWLSYFSVVTITTLGYGDITPLNAKASALASSEALIGQIYLVVIVAWLVGMHVSQRSKR